VELFEHFPTGKTLQFYLNPERDVPIESQRVHGISGEFLQDKPLFSAIVDELLEFLSDSPLVIHNASFDMRVLNAELARVSRPPLHISRAIDTIEIAKRKIPGARYSLDELCKRFGVDLSARTKHGALLDADLTAQIYLELLGGRQQRLVLAPADAKADAVQEIRAARARPQALAARLTEEEKRIHAAFIAKELGEAAVWKLANAD
jgi:DNA polymerase-3 subunit epsilon